MALAIPNPLASRNRVVLSGLQSPPKPGHVVRLLDASRQPGETVFVVQAVEDNQIKLIGEENPVGLMDVIITADPRKCLHCN